MNLRKHKTYQILVRFVFLLAVYMIAMGTITVMTFTKATPTLADEHNKQILTDKDFSSKDLTKDSFTKSNCYYTVK